MSVQTEKNLPEQLKATWLKALSAMQLKNYGYTIQLLQSVMKAAPEFLGARQLARKAAIARASSKKGLLSGLSTSSFSAMKIGSTLKKDPAAALEAIEKILETEPFSAPANHLLYEAAVALKMTDTAIFALETIIQGAPKDTKTMHELAAYLITVEQSSRSVDIYNKILEITPSDLAAIKGSKDASARASMQKGGWEKENTTYRDLIRDKEQAISLEQKGRVVRSEEMIDQQLAELHQQVEAQPQNVDISRKIAELYEQKEDFGSAIQWFEYAFQLGGGADLALTRKAADLRLRQYDDSIKQWEAYIASGIEDPDLANAITQLAEIKQQRDEVRLQEAKNRVDRNPTDLQFRYELGEIFLSLGMTQEAIPELQKARQNPNVRTRAMNLLGRCYDAKGMYDMAAKILSDAAGELLSMDSTKKEIIYSLGLVYEKMGEKEKSIESMKLIYEVDYDYKDVAPRVEGAYE